jgi:hypothetical protein
LHATKLLFIALFARATERRTARSTFSAVVYYSYKKSLAAAAAATSNLAAATANTHLALSCSGGGKHPFLLAAGA